MSVRDLHAALASLRGQLAELDALQLDESDAAPLRAELHAAIAQALQAAGGDASNVAAGAQQAAPFAGVPHTAALGNTGIHPRNRRVRVHVPRLRTSLTTPLPLLSPAQIRAAGARLWRAGR